MPMEQFGQHLLPSLLSLSSDPVANVRVLVAKALRQSVMEKGKKYHKKPIPFPPPPIFLLLAELVI